MPGSSSFNAAVIAGIALASPISPSALMAFRLTSTLASRSSAVSGSTAALSPISPRPDAARDRMRGSLSLSACVKAGVARGSENSLRAEIACIRTSGLSSLSSSMSAGTARVLRNSPSAIAAWRRTPSSLSFSAMIKPSTAASDGLFCAVTPRAGDHSSDGCTIARATPRQIALDLLSVRKKTASGLMSVLSSPRFTRRSPAMLEKQHQRSCVS
jgi:hypothetical protein